MIKKLSQPIENAPLIVFRIFFGLIFLFESVGSLLTGWATNNYANVKTNFTFIGFEWLSFLNSEIIYGVFAVMALLSIRIILGANYRISIIGLFILWGMVYLGQKTSYNNHYYLMWLITFLMCWVPANAYASVDCKKNPAIYSLTAPRWSIYIFPTMIAIVYFYATIAKLYPDWLQAVVTRDMFVAMDKPDFLKPLFHNHTFHYFIAYMGILFDGLIIPALLFRKTRVIAIIASLIFHIFNSVTLQIGVFPYFALAFCIFFFPPETIRAFFLRKKTPLSEVSLKKSTSTNRAILTYIIIPFVALQVLLPLRHWLIPGDVLYTEEGHRLSWRMMLRSRRGEAVFKVKDIQTGEFERFDNSVLLTPKQRQRLNSPDVIWQMAQKIKEYYLEQGKNVEVYCIKSAVTINKTYHNQLIDPEVDLANEPWHWFTHESWILDPNSRPKGIRKVLKPHQHLK